MHHLPKDIDVSGINHAMGRVDMNADPAERARSASPDEFPSLNHVTNAGNGRGGFRYGRDSAAYHDPGRTRFAAAVKKPVPAAAPATPVVQSPKDPALLAARREAMGAAAEPLHHNTSIIAPKPSPRIKLRPPTLLPTLPTGDAVNQLYMNYRSR